LVVDPAASKAVEEDVGGGDVEFVPSEDLAMRERFVVPSTGTVLSTPEAQEDLRGQFVLMNGGGSSAHWITRSGCVRRRRCLRSRRIRWSSSYRRRH